MRLAVLGSGSSGNAVVIESGPAGGPGGARRRLLLDAGFSRRQILRRFRHVLETAGELPDDPRREKEIRFDALLLTHEHGDHVRGADVLVRRHGVGVWATEGTLESSKLSTGAREHARVVRSGHPFEVAGFQADPFHVPHDAREPIGFVVEDATGRRVGLVADIGSRSRLAWSKLRDLDVLILETNHDLQMLRTGPYPWSLKERVASRHGHLSNADAAEGLREALQSNGDRLRTVVCYHLSRTNNDPRLVADRIGEVLEREGSAAEVVIACQDAPTPWLAVPEPIAVHRPPVRQLGLFA